MITIGFPVDCVFLAAEEQGPNSMATGHGLDKASVGSHG